MGSVIPCALFYFLQLYLKRHRSNPNPPTPPPSPDSEPAGPLVELPVLPRSLSRTLLSPRCPGGPVYVSARANSVLKGGQSPYEVGLRKVSEDPYDELGNPDGVIQLGLDENKLSLDLVRDWLVENAEDAILGGGELGISGIACYQPFDGFMELKVVCFIFSLTSLYVCVCRRIQMRIHIESSVFSCKCFNWILHNFVLLEHIL